MCVDVVMLVSVWLLTVLCVFVRIIIIENVYNKDSKSSKITSNLHH